MIPASPPTTTAYFCGSDASLFEARRVYALSLLRVNVELLRKQRTAAPPDWSEVLDDLAHEAERMGRLVEGLLDLERLLQICGAEALIRWRHPTKGIILPDQFIPLAEETGMITQIGEWLLQTACADAAGWPVDIKVAVNLSAVQFRKNNLVDVVLCALA